MRPINKNKHDALITVLKLLNKNHSAGSSIEESDITYLEYLYEKYGYLLNELSGCIKEYETLHHRLKTDILAPSLKTAKKQGIADAESYVAAVEYIKISRQR